MIIDDTRVGELYLKNGCLYKRDLGDLEFVEMWGVPIESIRFQLIKNGDIALTDIQRANYMSFSADYSYIIKAITAEHERYVRGVSPPHNGIKRRSKPKEPLVFKGKVVFFPKGETLFECETERTRVTKYVIVNTNKQEYYVDITNVKMRCENYNITESGGQVKGKPKEMSTAEAKKTLVSVGQQIMDSKKPVNQYKLNIFSNIITKNLLPDWADGYTSFKVVLDTGKIGKSVQFNPPKFTNDFVSRFINGHESLHAHMHQRPEIKINITADVFDGMDKPEDAYNFFKACIEYYDRRVEPLANKVLMETTRFNHSLKHLISTSKLAGLVSVPLSLLFSFNKVDITDKNFFVDSVKSDADDINKFMSNILSTYASPEKEKNKIISDLRGVVQSLREHTNIDDCVDDMCMFIEQVQSYYNGDMNDEITSYQESFQNTLVDTEGMHNADEETQLMYEKFGVKKLKRFPAEMVPYIRVETQAIRTPNDKMMIACYCANKLEQVEWYIELLETGSTKYVVPHTKQQLITISTQLHACMKQIMAAPIKHPGESNYRLPPGYDY